ncbi:MAG: hypothetical protein LBK23_02025 [Oscillospiraceae bacterium]|jgi:hypothetical protein|nr:hypothetical protein [Oscillospiraceae bacterium]
MTEPNKIPQYTPEDYHPKKPEILNIAEAAKARAQTVYAVKAANGGSYIDGVPMLKWGEWRDNSYGGCVAALLNAAGFPVTYEEVMGLSGACYQAIMLDDWDPSSQMPQNGLLCERNTGDALGVDVYSVQDEADICERAKRSIDGGYPVLLVGGRWEPEWTLACGYAVESGVTKFFGRTYFDFQNHIRSAETIEHQSTKVPENEIYTENGYFYLNGFPGVAPGALTRFYNKTCAPISRKQALKISLETCVKMFEQPPREHGHKYGYDAYDVLISGFELDDAAYRAKCTNVQYHIGSMQDARRAAHAYLSANADLLGKENDAKLSAVAEIYRKMTDNLLAAVPYEETTAVFDGGGGSVWDKARRLELTAALKKNKDLERQARIIAADILNNWEDK